MNSVIKNSKIWDGILKAVLVLLIVAVIATPVAGTMFTFLSEDDFSYESGGLEGSVLYQSSIVGSFMKTANIYKSQQGCYTPMFLDHLFRPYSRFGMPGFHFAMFSYVAIFLASVFAVSFVLIKNKTVSLAVILALVLSFFTMSYTRLDTDIMYWHTETLGYTLMLGFMLFALIFSVLSVINNGYKTVIYIILSSVFAFLASGASLTLVAVNCAVMGAVLIIDYKELIERKFLVIPFVAGFIGALINAVAPGNFVRADDSAVPGHETLLDGIRDTFTCAFGSFFKAVDIIFILTAIILIALCILYKVEVIKGGLSGIRMLIILGGVIVIHVIEAFPAAYGGKVGQLEGHLLIEHIIAVRFTMIFVVVCFAQWLREHFAAIEKQQNALKIACAVAALLILVLPVTRGIMHDSFTARTYRDLRSGAAVRSYRVREYVLSTFQMAEDGTDCIIYVPWDTSTESFPGMGIGADSEWFENRSAANLFGLHTTTILTP